MSSGSGNVPSCTFSIPLSNPKPITISQPSKEDAHVPIESGNPKTINKESVKTGATIDQRNMGGDVKPTRLKPPDRPIPAIPVQVPKELTDKRDQMRTSLTNLDREVTAAIRLINAKDPKVNDAALANKLMMSAESAKALAIEVAASALNVKPETLEKGFPRSVKLSDLKPAERQMFTELVNMHGKSRTLGEQLANAHEEVNSGTIGLSAHEIRQKYDSVAKDQTPIQRTATLKRELLDGITPGELTRQDVKVDSRSFKRSKNVNERNQAMNSMLYKFDRQLRFDTKTRILAGTNPKEMDNAIDETVANMKLLPCEKAFLIGALKNKLRDNLTFPIPRTTTNSDRFGSRGNTWSKRSRSEKAAAARFSTRSSTANRW